MQLNTKNQTVDTSDESMSMCIPNSDADDLSIQKSCVQHTVYNIEPNIMKKRKTDNEPSENMKKKDVSGIKSYLSIYSEETSNSSTPQLKETQKISRTCTATTMALNHAHEKSRETSVTSLEKLPDCQKTRSLLTNTGSTLHPSYQTDCDGTTVIWKDNSSFFLDTDDNLAYEEVATHCHQDHTYDSSSKDNSGME